MILLLLNFEQITNINLQSYKELINDNKMISNHENFFGVGLSLEGSKVGAAIGTLHQKKVYLQSIKIDPSHRRNGLGSQLLKFTEKKLKQAGFQQLIIEYMDEVKGASISDAFFMSQGWHEPETRIHQYIVKVRDEPLGIFNNTSLPKGFSFFPWRDLKNGERDEILAGKGIWYPEILSPFYEEEKLDKNLSFGLKFRNDIVGWFIIQRVAKNMVLAQTIFVKDDVLPVRRAVPLLVEAYKKFIAEKNIEYATGFVENENQLMLHFVDKYFAKDILRKRVLKRSTKSL